MRPRLIHPRPVILHRRKKTDDIDPDFKETPKTEWEDPVTLQGQVKYNKWKQLTPVGGGNAPVSDGHIVFDAEAWRNSGGQETDELELESGARLVVTEIRPAAHYSGKNWHVHVLFLQKRVTAK